MVVIKVVIEPQEDSEFADEIQKTLRCPFCMSKVPHSLFWKGRAPRKGPRRKGTQARHDQVRM